MLDLFAGRASAENIRTSLLGVDLLPIFDSSTAGCREERRRSLIAPTSRRDRGPRPPFSKVCSDPDHLPPRCAASLCDAGFDSLQPTSKSFGRMEWQIRSHVPGSVVVCHALPVVEARR